ncbi:MAG: phosphate ABC transporter permease PstA [Acidobacteriaceae bacterium]|nr:phosphate ABC transporter permease PstA [Acidobacteriaceae bacterium]MBV9764199.1 phosphate ABC transporter permease PstA [Acidobacteriaceae bacterium]
MMMEISARRRVTNAVMLSLSGICTLLVIGVLFFILGYLLWEGARSLNLDFFTKLPKPSGETGGGMANAIVGSGKVLLIATLIGVPIGFLAGVFLAEYSGKMFAFTLRYTVDLLNGVPSIVVGIVAYALVVRPMGHFSALAGGVALGIMMIPIAVRTTEEFLRSVPNSMREGAMALGATKAKTIFTVVVPAAISGLLSGMMLNLARVAGETAPLLFTALGNMFWSHGWLQPIATLPVMIYNYALAPDEDLHQQAWAAGFVLLALVLVINITARLIIARGAAGLRR